VWDADFTDEYGNFDYAAMEQAKAEWASKWGDQQANIDRYIELGRTGEPQAISELREARAVMAPYFAVKDQMLAQAGMTDLFEQYNVYINSHPLMTDQQRNRIKAMTGLAPVLEYISNYQKRMRESSPQINYYYQKYYS
jgi:hypothetical protein